MPAPDPILIPGPGPGLDLDPQAGGDVSARPVPAQPAPVQDEETRTEGLSENYTGCSSEVFGRGGEGWRSDMY